METQPQKITILVIREENQPHLDVDKTLHPNIEICNFPIEQDSEAYKKNTFSLLHALSATPARYLEAAFKKGLVQLTPPFFLLNPLIQMDNKSWALLIPMLKEIPKKKSILISSINDIPIGLFLSDDAVAVLGDSDLLLFLSWVSAGDDFTAINTIIKNIEKKFILTNFRIISKSNYHNNPEYLTIYKKMTLHYIQSFIEEKINNKRADCIAVMPYHAGDVMFFCLAFKQTKHPFDAIMVHSSFSDIVSRILPEVKIYSIPTDPPHRGSNKNTEDTIHKNQDVLHFFHSVYPYIPHNASFYYFRHTYAEHAGDIHFIDQWKFSLSNDTFELFNKKNDDDSEPMSENNCIDKSVLIHYDAGWNLKVYPEHYQLKLLKLLKEAGYRISILSDKALTFSANKISFTSLKILESQIKSHALFVGMDSFPVHFSAHILKHPSIKLFSSTAVFPAASPTNIFQDDLQKGLSCSPCGSRDICPAHNTNYCHNFSSPEDVFSMIEKIYEKKYQEVDNEQKRSIPLSFFVSKKPLKNNEIKIEIVGSHFKDKNLFSEKTRKNIVRFIRWIFHKTPYFVLRAFVFVSNLVNKVGVFVEAEITKRV